MSGKSQSEIDSVGRETCYSFLLDKDMIRREISGSAGRVARHTNADVVLWWVLSNSSHIIACLAF